MLSFIQKLFGSVPPSPLLLTMAVELYVQFATDVSKKRKNAIRYDVAKWVRFGLPADARMITMEDFGKARQLMSAAGHAPVTVEGCMSTITTLLKHLGPKTDSTPHGRGLLESVPYAGRKLPIRLSPRIAVPLSHLEAVYRIASQSDYAPAQFAGPPVLFWRCFLAISYSTGLRFGDLTKLRRTMHNEDLRCLTITASKTGKIQLLPVTPILLRHLQAIPGNSDRLLMISASSHHYLCRKLSELCDKANVPRFTAQSIRRRASIEYELAHPGSGGLLLGHTVSSATSSAVTFTHYIPALETVLRPASEKVAHPPSFLIGPTLPDDPQL